MVLRLSSIHLSTSTTNCYLGWKTIFSQFFIFFVDAPFLAMWLFDMPQKCFFFLGLWKWPRSDVIASNFLLLTNCNQLQSYQFNIKKVKLVTTAKWSWISLTDQFYSSIDLCRRDKVPHFLHFLLRCSAHSMWKKKFTKIFHLFHILYEKSIIRPLIF